MAVRHHRRPICAVLPNAAVVILVAPLIISICRQMELDFVQPVILLVFAANSAGLLTLVGDPATFIVGSAIRLSFTHYLGLLSPGGVLAILAVVAVLPLIFRSVWRTRMMGDMALAPARIDRPWVMLAYLVALAVMVGALEKTGMIGALGKAMGASFGSNNVVLAGLLLLGGIGALSSIIPNIPLVVAMVPLVKEYAVGAGLATPAAIEVGYGQIPGAVLPLFLVMWLGATLGGNATLLGASSNIVAGGICAQNGRPVTFMAFLRYRIPVTLVQRMVAAGYLWARFL